MTVYATQRKVLDQVSIALTDELDRLAEQFHEQIADVLRGISDAEAVQRREPSDPTGEDDEAVRVTAARSAGIAFAIGRSRDALDTVAQIQGSGVFERIKQDLDGLRTSAWEPVDAAAQPSADAAQPAQPSASGDAAQPSGDAAVVQPSGDAP